MSSVACLEGMASPTAIHLGLDRIQQALQVLHFSSTAPIVTIGGTNGKGSTVFLTSRLLEHAGYKVGTYTSPHLHSLHERIAINQQPIPETDLFRWLEHLKPILKENKIALTYFEILTVVALLYFQEQKCTQIVLEVGMGGRLDAVNAVEPTVCVLTTVSFDHQEYLGNTLEAIAIEKSGIARAKKPILVGIGAQSPTMDLALNEIGAVVEYEAEDFCCLTDQTGGFLSTHIALATRAFEWVVGYPVASMPNVDTWIWPGRFEHYQAMGTDWILDVAHNPESVALLAKKLVQYRVQYPGIVAVWHSLVDKDLEAIVSLMAPVIDHWVLAPIDSPRATPLGDLEVVVRQQGQKIEKSIIPYTQQGYLMVVFGGFNIVSDFRKILL